MASLTGTKIKDTYDGLLKTTDNGGLGASAKQITDGLGTGSPLYIDTSNVGIGKVPSEKLDIEGASPFIRISNTDETESGIVFVDSASAAQSAKITYDSGASNALIFYNNAASERMRITSGGQVLIGRETAGLNNTGGGFLQAGQLFLESGSDVLSYMNRYGTDGDVIVFRNDNSSVGSISVSGSSTAYNTSSDYRLKEDWQPMADALTRVDALKPVNFAWKSSGDRVDGFLAHELQEVIPEAVTGEKDAMRDEEYEVSPAVYEDVIHPAEEAVYEEIQHDAIAEELDADGNVIVEAQEAYTEEVLVSEAKEEWTEQVLISEAVMGTRSVPDYQGIDQSKIVPLLVAAIQELKAEIDALKGA